MIASCPKGVRIPCGVKTQRILAALAGKRLSLIQPVSVGEQQGQVFKTCCHVGMIRAAYLLMQYEAPASFTFDFPCGGDPKFEIGYTVTQIGPRRVCFDKFEVGIIASRE